MQEPWSNLAARGEYAAAIGSEALPAGMPSEFATSFLADAESQLLNFTGRYVEAHRAISPNLFESEISSESPERTWLDLNTIDELTAVDAFDYIRSAVSGRQIVIINESHQMGQHRAVMSELLPILREEGFTHFGMEALSEVAETAWQSNGAPIQELGFYFNDPLMTNVLVTADALNFDWFAYEVRGEQRLDCSERQCSRSDRIEHRETAQAQNIFDRVFATNPEARVVLYVGLRHLDEARGMSEDGLGNNWMAAVLAELTGLDPLTIDQVSGSGVGPDEVVQSARAIHHQLNIDVPSVLIDQSGHVVEPPQARWDADIVLFSPIEWEVALGERPGWMQSLSGRMPIAIDISSLDQRPIVVQAFRLPKTERALAVDQYAILDGEAVEQVDLILAPGQYAIEVQMPGESHTLLDFLEVTGD